MTTDNKKKGLDFDERRINEDFIATMEFCEKWNFPYEYVSIKKIR